MLVYLNVEYCKILLGIKENENLINASLIYKMRLAF